MNLEKYVGIGLTLLVFLFVSLGTVIVDDSIKTKILAGLVFLFLIFVHIYYCFNFMKFLNIRSFKQKIFNFENFVKEIETKSMEIPSLNEALFVLAKLVSSLRQDVEDFQNLNSLNFKTVSLNRDRIKSKFILIQIYIMKIKLIKTFLKVEQTYLKKEIDSTIENQNYFVIKDAFIWMQNFLPKPREGLKEFNRVKTIFIKGMNAYHLIMKVSRPIVGRRTEVREGVNLSRFVLSST